MGHLRATFSIVLQTRIYCERHIYTGMRSMWTNRKCSDPSWITQVSATKLWYLHHGTGYIRTNMLHEKRRRNMQICNLIIVLITCVWATKTHVGRIRQIKWGSIRKRSRIKHLLLWELDHGICARTLSQSESMQMCIGGTPAIIGRWITSWWLPSSRPRRDRVCAKVCVLPDHKPHKT